MKDQESGYGMVRREAIKRAALLLGSALASSTIAGSLHAQRAELGKGASWSPTHLSEAQARIVSVASELILPRSDTPGAIDVGVPQFIDLIFGKFMLDDEKQRFEGGLAKLQQARFVSLEEREQLSFLKSPSKTSASFLRQLRELTITGYFTSEEVAKTMLRYDPVPGKYRGCVSVDEVGNVLMSEN
ncbi:gluconate 2-dehydrogenase subunit 3 family protein [Pelagicoccus enzymogenes]|uniref:gluconate 2-dehydrogenase subunit 3 family protein n=1 Tax=Pelagicoccus enzymogenes TaxID=2773457 RepID=UPI00280D0236|nr:gluconate 2-dehydrogenase subunit 3 family protein [Pelagicoccus enzymogenes]MDQ8199920.1 gluconate 2-dehydrogenase subunit 3 family protein [Pelagicoccus enzymogenes]